MRPSYRIASNIRTTYLQNMDSFASLTQLTLPHNETFLPNYRPK